MPSMMQFICIILTVITLSASSCVYSQSIQNNTPDTGIKGETGSMIFSGVEGGESKGGPLSMEFAVAPVEGGIPLYEKAIYIKSDEQGKFKVALPPGRYWIGPAAKALDPKQFQLSSAGPPSFIEKIVVVKESGFTHVNLYHEDYAP